jgi:hypothetical protein
MVMRLGAVKTALGITVAYILRQRLALDVSQVPSLGRHLSVLPIPLQGRSFQQIIQLQLCRLPPIEDRLHDLSNVNRRMPLT